MLASVACDEIISVKKHSVYMPLQIFYQTGGQSHLMWDTKNQGKN